MNPPYTRATMTAMRIVSETVYSFGLSRSLFSTQCASDDFTGLAKGFLQRKAYAESMYDLMHARTQEEEEEREHANIMEEMEEDFEDGLTVEERQARSKLEFASDNYSTFMDGLRRGQMYDFRDKMRSESMPAYENTPMAQDIHFLSQRVGECHLDPPTSSPTGLTAPTGR